MDGFLRAHGVYEDYTMEDLKREREDLPFLATNQFLQTGDYLANGDGLFFACLQGDGKSVRV